MAVQDQDDAETRSILLSAARGLLTENPNFSLKTLLIQTEVSRAQFRRCFADKEQLLAALTGQEVRQLNEILDVAQPAAVPLAMAVNAAPAPALVPPTDAWLERRLRVFERALAGLEKRQEKSEEVMTQQLARIAEQLAARAAPQEAPKPTEVAPKPVAEPAPHNLLLFKQLEAEVAAPPAPAREKPAQEKPAEDISLLSPDFDPADEARVERGPDLFEIDQIAGPIVEPPVTEREMSDFLAHARRVAQNAARTEKKPQRARWDTRWLAWSGAILIVILFFAGVLIANGALGGAAGASTAASGVSHRQVAQTGMARVMALADNGNASAQTVLAMDYLKGNGVTGDDKAAKRWSLAAASQGQPVAQYLLGTLYLEGDKNESEAAHWFQAAADQGNIRAMHNLAIAYAEGLGVQKDPAQAAQWFMRAAQQGYRDSEFDLAVLYERGLGVPQSAPAALKWYLIAAARGDAPSAARATFLKQQLDAAEVKAASQEATSFKPVPSGHFANQTPEL